MIRAFTVAIAFMRRIGMLGVCCALLWGCYQPDDRDLLTAVLERGVLRVSVDAHSPPLSDRLSDGTFEGFEIEVVEALGIELGVEIRYATPAWNEVVGGQWDDRWDISLGGAAITREREEALHFVRPPYSFAPAQFGAAEAAGLTTLADIDGQQVCVPAETIYAEWLNGDDIGLPADSVYAEPPSNVQVIPVETDTECFLGIESGSADYVLMLTSSAILHDAMVHGAPLVGVGNAVFAEAFAIAVDRSHSRDPASLVHRLGEIITELHADGTLRAASEKWLGADRTRMPNAAN